VNDLFPPWQRFEQLLRSGHTARTLGFTGSDGDVSRFLARHRLASSFRGATFDEYSERTSAAYSALLKLFLTWGAFESFCRITGRTKSGGGLDHTKLRVLLTGRDRPELELGDRRMVQLRRVLGEYTTHQKLRDRLESDTCSPYDIAQALRHTFAHGPLTAHGSKSPAAVRDGANRLADWLLEVMAEEFAMLLNSNT